ncbi:MAG: Fur family transcriptional regulator [Terrimesophilobacter sp.]
MTPAHELRGAGLRVTGGRMALLDAITSRPHSDAESLFRALKKALPSLSVQSVHNMLRDLSDAGLLRRIEPAGSAARYERRTGDNHHHLVCISCKSIVDVDCVEGKAPCLTPSDAAGYAVTMAEVTFWGLCASCQDLPSRTDIPQATHN